MSMQNKIIVITGASAGIGRAVARLTAGQGARVALLDVDEAAGAALAAEIGATFIRCDVASPEDWAVAAQAVVDELGPPDHVHLNAGIMAVPAGAPDEGYRFDAMSLEAYRKIFGVNVDGVVFGVRTLAPLMARGSSIVATASLAGVVPYAFDPIYATTKHAVVGFVRSVARELGERGVRINAICPGGIDTNIIPASGRAAELMRPESVAEDVLFLFETEATGEAWAKVSDDKPVFILHPPGSGRRQARRDEA